MRLFRRHMPEKEDQPNVQQAVTAHAEQVADQVAAAADNLDRAFRRLEAKIPPPQRER